MAGLATMCKLYGSLEVTDQDGNKKTWVYDYFNDKPRLKSEMTKEELLASKKAKWTLGKNKI
jgi:major membrane immunogen (membrane-anchored lipoprotein)